MAYYTLCTYDEQRGKWCPQFGDSDREVVRQEQLDSYQDDRCKIVRSNSSKQADVDLAVARLNQPR
jgi:hypothetical protein